MDYSARHNAFRDLLKQVRKDAGLTQVELAEKLGKPQSYISKAEQGERRMDFVETLDFCAACGVSVDSFVKQLEALCS
ncbi:MAG: helix-turn-helix domain-containing protein [Verrucomicrobiales bacterium]